MAVITASQVKELRERTGVGMMECKKALDETDGNIEEAIIALRKSGQAKAAKKSDRVANQGIIAIKVANDAKTAIIVEVNCETDFVARDNNFIDFANTLAVSGLSASVKNIDELLAIVLESGITISQAREDLVLKIGENINIRRIQLLIAQGTIGSYVHSNNRIGVLVDLLAENSELGRDLAMHIAASRPIVVSPQDLPQDLLDKEKEIVLAQVQSSGKPPEILEKMISGRMNKFMDESSLLKQLFVKNPDLTVTELLEQNHAKVFSFIRFEVGESID